MQCVCGRGYSDDLRWLLRCGRARPQEDGRYVTELYLYRRVLDRCYFCCTGVSEYTVSLEEQLVTVKGSIGYDELLEKIKKTGKEVSAVTMLSVLEC